MDRQFCGRLTRGPFSTLEMTLTLRIVGQSVRKAQGRVDLTEELELELMNSSGTSLFEFQCSDGLKFDLYVRHADLLSPYISVESSGSIPGFLE